MMATLCWMLVLGSLAGCSSGIGSSAKQLAKCGKLDVGSRMEIRVEFDEPISSEREPCPPRRQVYDQSDKSGSVLDQSFGVVGAYKF